MRIAVCSLDGLELRAAQFALLRSDEIKRRRPHLLCPECRQPAGFARAVAGRRSAYFFAHHLEGCDMASEREPHPPSSEDRTDFDVLDQSLQASDAFESPASNAVSGDVQPDLPGPWVFAPTVLNAPRTAEPEDAFRPRIQRDFSGRTAQPVLTNIRARTLLVRLLRVPNWRAEPDQHLVVPGLGMVNPRDFLTPIWRVAWTNGALEGTHGFWGRVLRCTFEADLTLDFGRAFAVRATIPKTDAEVLLRRAWIGHPQELHGGFAFITGSIEMSPSPETASAISQRRWRVRLSDVRRSALLSRDHARRL